MTTKVKFRRVYLNPDNLEKRGFAKKIESVLYRGNKEIEIEFTVPPTKGELQAILNFLQKGRWEIVEG